MIHVKFWEAIISGQLKIDMSTFLLTKLKLIPQLKTFQVQIPWQNLSLSFQSNFSILGTWHTALCFLYLWHVLDTSYFYFCSIKCIITVSYLFSYHLSQASRTQYRGAGHGSFYRDMIISDSWVNVTCSYSSLRHPRLLMDWEDH